MARSVWKGPFVDGYLLKKAETSRGSGRNEVIKTWSRRSTILPQFVGLTFGVYNGHKFLPVLVTENGIATDSEGKSAWFQDSEGNYLCLTQPAQPM